MRLIKQIISRNVAKFEEGVLNNKYYFQNFYIAYGFALAYLELKGLLKINENEIEIKNRLFKLLNKKIFYDSLKSSKTVSEAKKKYFEKSEKLFRLLQNMVRRDYIIINRFMDLFEQNRVEIQEFSDLYKVGTIGIVEYEFPDD